MINVCIRRIDTSYESLKYVTVRYVWNKGSIEGPSWKMPFIGPFLQSVNPKMDEYKAKWASGDLSCVSVFHKYDQLSMIALIGNADPAALDLW